MSKIDAKGLATLMAEASQLTNRSKLTAQEDKRFNLLLSQIALLKTGEVTLADLQLDEVNEIAQRHGLPLTKRQAGSSETRAKAEAWQMVLKLASENRTANETQGSIIARIGTYSGLGTFIPTEFIQETYAAMAAHDAFLDENAVSMMNSTNGRVTEIPTFGDIENVAQVVGESADTSSSEANISAPGKADSVVYSYRSPLWRLPIEVMQDVEAMGNAVSLFKAFAADRIARGAAKDLTNGNGSGKPLGIVNALLAASVTPVTAAGSAGNTGGSEDGTNSIGTKDLADLYFSVNEAYRSQPKCAWFMNDTTRTYLATLVTKMGLPLVEWDDAHANAFIMGKPVRISPSMQGIGAGNIPVVFGDGAYWLSRNVVDNSGESQDYVQLVKEAAGLIEKGLVGLRMFCRWGGSLLYTDANSPAPFGLLQNHT
jgi:HK97 family phage major capsid protein